jgi:hypothetical protein
MASYRSKRRKINQEVELQLRQIELSCESTTLPPLDCNQQGQIILDESNQTNPDNESISLSSLGLEILECGSLDTSDDVASVTLQSSLARWSLKHNISHAALNDLLCLLKPRISNSNLPVCAKTVLKTPVTIEIQNRAGGQFYYFGVLNQIKTIIQTGLGVCKFLIIRKHESLHPHKKFLTLSVSTDGIPVCKSSNVQMWPILFKVDQVELCRPQIAGLFCGECKPICVTEFLRPFVNEMKNLENDGFVTTEIQFYVKISCIIADAPARSFVKGVKGHTAYHGCERCEDEGSWSGRMI